MSGKHPQRKHKKKTDLGQLRLYSLDVVFTLNFITMSDGPLYGTLMSLTDWLKGRSFPGASAAQSTARSSLPPLYPS
jgi:hypothetical protein